jgi:hypothetical protein
VALSPAMRRRRLAAELRKPRVAANLTAEQAVAGLAWQAPKLSGIENRQARISTAPDHAGPAEGPLPVWGPARTGSGTCGTSCSPAASARSSWRAPGDIPLAGCGARQRESSKLVLITLVRYLIRLSGPSAAEETVP